MYCVARTTLLQELLKHLGGSLRLQHGVAIGAVECSGSGSGPQVLEGVSRVRIMNEMLYLHHYVNEPIGWLEMPL